MTRAETLREQLRILWRWHRVGGIILGVGLLGGLLLGWGSPANTFTLVAGGVVVTLVGTAAAVDIGLGRAHAVGAPFLTVGLFSGAILARSGVSAATLGYVTLFVLTALAGLVLGALARADDKH